MKIEESRFFFPFIKFETLEWMEKLIDFYVNVGNFYNFVSWYNVDDRRLGIYRRPSMKDGTSSLIARSSDKRPIITTIVGASSRKSTPCSVYERSKDILSKGQRLLCSRVSIKRRTG